MKEAIRGRLSGRRYSGMVRRTKGPTHWILKSTSSLKNRAEVHSGRRPTPCPSPGACGGLPDSADVGARVLLQGWQDPESTILDPHSSLFFPWDSSSRIILTPCHVDMGADRRPQPELHLGAPQDHRFPFHSEVGFEMLAKKFAVFCCPCVFLRLNGEG